MQYNTEELERTETRWEAFLAFYISKVLCCVAPSIRLVSSQAPRHHTCFLLSLPPNTVLHMLGNTNVALVPDNIGSLALGCWIENPKMPATVGFSLFEASLRRSLNDSGLTGRLFSVSSKRVSLILSATIEDV